MSDPKPQPAVDDEYLNDTRRAICEEAALELLHILAGHRFQPLRREARGE